MTNAIDHPGMNTTIQTLRNVVSQHSRSTAILAALAATIDAQVSGMPLRPMLRDRIDELLGALGLDDITAATSPADLRPLLAEIRFTMLLDAKLLFDSTRSLAWDHTEPEILEAGGELSAGFVAPLAQAIVPRLAGLAQALAAPGGAFLDVGVGAAGLSIAVARRWPSLRVVGIDPWAPSLALARDNVRRAGLTDRIQVRQQAVEALGDTDAFDLAWLPTAFMPETVIPAAVEHVHRALRPGGWLLIAMVAPGADPPSAAVARLRTVLWGGSLLAPNDVEQLLSRAGFGDVQTLPSPPDAIVALVAARRMPST